MDSKISNQTASAVHSHQESAIFILSIFGWFLHVFYAKLIEIERDRLQESSRSLLKSISIACILFFTQCIFGSIQTWLTSFFGIQATPIFGKHWLCAVLESPCAVGFVVVAMCNTILIADHVRTRMMPFSSTIENRRVRLEKFHSKSVRKSIFLAWILGLIIAAVFVLATLIPLENRFECHRLIVVVPELILYSSIGLYSFFEIISSLTFVFILRRKREFEFYCRASTNVDLKQRLRFLQDQFTWRKIAPSIFLHKFLAALTIILVIFAKRSKKIEFCIITAELSLTAPTVITIYRLEFFRSRSVMIARGILNAIASKFRN